jgi:hypothetical protein
MGLYFKFKEDTIIYGRRVGTGNPTKTHIINEKTGNSFCGFDDFTSEISIASKSENMFRPNFCKKCLKGYEKEY